MLQRIESAFDYPGLSSQRRPTIQRDPWAYLLTGTDLLQTSQFT